MTRSLRQIVNDIDAVEKTLTVYATEQTAFEAVQRLFGSEHTRIEYRQLPEPVSEEFIVVYTDGEFTGAVGLDAVMAMRSPWIPTIGIPPDERVRALLATFTETTVTASDRGQLLAITRAFEHRAWQTGYGTLRVGFQSATALEQQLQGYKRMATETELDVHVYIDSSWDRSAANDVTVHAGQGEIGAFWFVIFDDENQPCALVVEEDDSGKFYGFWTEESDLVDELSTYVQSL